MINKVRRAQSVALRCVALRANGHIWILVRPAKQTTRASADNSNKWSLRDLIGAAVVVDVDVVAVDVDGVAAVVNGRSKVRCLGAPKVLRAPVATSNWRPLRRATTALRS